MVPGHRPDHGFDLARELLHLGEVGAEHLDPDRRADAGREHVDARLDRHGPGVGDAGELQRLVHLRDQLVDRHAGPPFALRLEIDDGLEHLGRRRVGRGRGAAGLAPDRSHFGEGLDDLVLGLHQLRGLGHRQAGKRGRHVEQRALVEIGHELGAEPHGRPHAAGQDRQRDEDGGGLEAQRDADHRAVEPDQQSVQRIAMLRHDAAAHEHHHERGHKRDRQQRRRRHGEGLGIGERLEQPAFLRLEREDRQERDGDDEEAEEQRRPDLDSGVDQHLSSGLVRWRAFEMLVGVLDHDDGGVDHGADGNGDAAEAHDVGAEPQEIHAEIGDQHAERQRDDGDQRAADVQQEYDADEGDDHALLHQRALERVDGAVDQVGAVIDRFDRDALGQARRDLGKAILDVADHRERILSEALQHDAGDDLALAVHLGDAAAFVGSKLDPGHVPEQHRHAALILDDDLFQVGQALDVAAPAHRELGFGKLDRASAHVHVAGAERVADFGERNAERLQPARVDDHAVLLDEAADARDLGHALRLGDAIADIPVLDGAQLGEALLRAAHDILINPADAGGVRPEARCHAGRQPPGG